MQFTKGQITAILGCSQAIEDKWIGPINEACAKYNINTKLRLAAFIAQVGHESDNLQVLTENLNYSAEGLMKIWPSRFNSDNADDYARQPQKIANKVYGGRLGNGPEPTGEGWKYRGRGLIQCTGKTNYDNFSQSCGADCLSNPDNLLQPTYAALSAGWFWDSRGLNEYADRQDFLGITKRINGGTVGQAKRELLYKKALIVLGGSTSPKSDEELSAEPVPRDSAAVTSPISSSKTPAASNSSIVEPRSASGEAGKYPWNLVFETRSGHYIEYDDTPGNERVNNTHRTGSYWEINSQGTFTIKTVLDSYKLTKADSYDYTGGSYTQQVKGQSYRQTSGNTVFKSGGDFFVGAPKIQFNTGMLSVSGEINSPHINSPLFSGMGKGMAFGDMLAKEAIVAYFVKKGRAPMIGGSIGFRSAPGGSAGSADGLMSNSLTKKAPNGTPWVTNGIAHAASVLIPGVAAAEVVRGMMTDDTEQTTANAMNSAAEGIDGDAANDDNETPVFLKHVTFDKPLLPSMSTSISAPDPGLYVNNLHTIVDALNGRGVLHMSNGTEWVPIGAEGAKGYTDQVAGELGDRIDQEIVDRAFAIAAEAQERAEAITAEALARHQEITQGLLDEAVARGAAVTAEATARQTADTSLANLITTLTAAVGENAAAIETEMEVRADAITAEATARETLATQVNNNTAAIYTESTTRSNQYSALATQISQLSSSTDDNFAAVVEQLETLTDADSALSSRIDALVVKTDNTNAAVTTEASARASADSALSTRIDAVLAEADTNAAAIVTEQTARASADSAIADQITALVTKTDNTNAAVAAESTARANGDSANATQISSVSAAVTIAQQDATNALNQISDISNDNILSKVEKSDLIKEYSILTNEQTSLEAQGTAFNITTEKTAYTTAINALKTYITGLTPAYNDTTQNTTITGSTFRTKFTDVYTARANLLNKIDSVAKALADAAQTSANTANAAIANISSDNVLSMGEKGAVILEYNVLTNEQTTLETQATTFGITTEKTAYTNAVNALKSYMTGLSPAYTDTSADTTIVGSTFRTKFSDVYTARQTLLNKIDSVAKAVADSKAKVTWSTTAPSSPSTGDVWMDTSAGSNKPVQKTWDGSAWKESDWRISQNTADIQTEATARANGDSANATSITNLTTSVNGQFATVNSTLSSHSDSLGNIQAQWAIKTNVNGHVSGISLISSMVPGGGGATSSFIVEADKFKIVQPGGTAGQLAPFSVDTVNNIIDLTANVRVKNLYVGMGGSGQRTEIDNNGMRVYDSSGNLRVRLGIW